MVVAVGQPGQPYRVHRRHAVQVDGAGHGGAHHRGVNRERRDSHKPVGRNRHFHNLVNHHFRPVRRADDGVQPFPNLGHGGRRTADGRTCLRTREHDPMSCEPIQIIQQIQEITVCGQSITPQFAPYSFTATSDGQTTFGPLAQVPVSVITCAITGTIQNPSVDYRLDTSGLYIILSEGIATGNTVYGMIQTT